MDQRKSRNRCCSRCALVAWMLSLMAVLASGVARAQDPPQPAAGAAAEPGSAPAPAQQQVKNASPLSFRIGDAEFTPGGFMDFTAVFRTTNLGSGIASTFGSAPFSNTTAGHLTETRFSAQNSRVSLKVDSSVDKNKVTGYLEADFLGFQPPNASVTSNSDSLRMRLYWVDVRHGHFEFLAGQTWSMLTPGRKGISPAPADIFYTQNMDANYEVGLTWTRAPEFRFVYHPTENWALAIALENPDQYITSAVKLPAVPCGATPPPLCFLGQLDEGLSNSTPNLHPDVIGKVAYDSQLAGRQVHAEVAGLLSSFKIFNPSTSTASSITGGGASANLNVEAIQNLRLILTTFYSYGGGRYIFGLGPDLIVKPDGRPSGVHAASAIAGFEYQARPKEMIYGYYGGAYFARNTAIDPATGNFLGFGYPGSPGSSNRAIQEPTVGFIHTFWKNPRYGALQWINQYSYLTRSPWSVAPGEPKNAHLSMVFMDLRYTLP